MATNAIDIVFRFKVKAGEEERYQRAIDSILPITEEQEPYVLEYEIYRDADGVYTQHERYADEDAVHRHMEVTAPGQADWAAATDLEQVIVLGDMSEKFWNLYGGPHAKGYSPFRKIKR